ncbi:MAG: EamA/RhaT family transporter [Tenericutes bacterium HGW-Tenericutes-2]|jgi:drug/metabolite transporter (DMT)-like permease|nr:MAG: EamA/RhaT family transporter [Tenericutes bacterium HGW-Tenericutes-3]PKK97950.1 MAG: EamA/RhaT family transporter [Tenericutes bacterium HGW-Tenericutes-2]
MKFNRSIFYAILAAVLYALSTPISKLLLISLSPVYIASLLYLGAGMGMGLIALIRNKTANKAYESFTPKELPFIIGMIVLDIVAPIFLMIGLSTSLPENVALLNNFEIVATALFAAFIFKEVISKRLRLAIILITLASFILSFEDINALKFSTGSFFVLLAAISWGLENNLTRRLSLNDPLMVVVIKGLFSGLGSLIIALILNEVVLNINLIVGSLLLGFVAYGLSIFFYVTAQRELGAAKTSAFYAFAPFVGAIVSLIIFLEPPMINFYFAIFLMAIGSYYASTSGKKTIHD